MECGSDGAGSLLVMLHPYGHGFGPVTLTYSGTSSGSLTNLAQYAYGTALLAFGAGASLTITVDGPCTLQFRGTGGGGGGGTCVWNPPTYHAGGGGGGAAACHGHNVAMVPNRQYGLYVGAGGAGAVFDYNTPPSKGTDGGYTGLYDSVIPAWLMLVYGGTGGTTGGDGVAYGSQGGAGGVVSAGANTYAGGVGGGGSNAGGGLTADVPIVGANSSVCGGGGGGGRGGGSPSYAYQNGATGGAGYVGAGYAGGTHGDASAVYATAGGSSSLYSGQGGVVTSNNPYGGGGGGGGAGSNCGWANEYGGGGGGGGGTFNQNASPQSGGTGQGGLGLILFLSVP